MTGNQKRELCFTSLLTKAEPETKTKTQVQLMSKTIPGNRIEGVVKVRQGMMLWKLELKPLWGLSDVLEKTLPSCVMETEYSSTSYN